MQIVINLGLNSGYEAVGATMFLSQVFWFFLLMKKKKKKKKKLLKLHKDNTIKKNIFIFKKKKDR